MREMGQKWVFGIKLGYYFFPKFILVAIFLRKSIFQKNLVPEIWFKMLTANQTSGFSNLSRTRTIL